MIPYFALAGPLFNSVRPSTEFSPPSGLLPGEADSQVLKFSPLLRGSILVVSKLFWLWERLG